MYHHRFHTDRPLIQLASAILLVLAWAASPLPAAAEDDRDWWAFQPLVNPEIPAVQDERWSQNPIDRFIYHRLAENKIQPAPQADRTTLARRLYFNLIGLPPTPEQIDDFVADQSPEAWEKLIDRLLSDPRYGEHWARFWLDLVRYA